MTIKHARNALLTGVFLICLSSNCVAQHSNVKWYFEKSIAELQPNDTIYQCLKPFENFFIFEGFNSDSDADRQLVCNHDVKSNPDLLFYFKELTEDNITVLRIRIGLRMIVAQIQHFKNEQVLLIKGNTYLD